MLTAMTTQGLNSPSPRAEAQLFHRMLVRSALEANA